MKIGKDSYNVKKRIVIDNREYSIYSLRELEKTFPSVSRLPITIKILLENLLRHEDGSTVVRDDIDAVARWDKNPGTEKREIAFHPTRVLMQDFTGVPAIVDLAAMRDAMKVLDADPEKINPMIPVDLVIDHSVSVDFYGNVQSMNDNVKREYERNGERYRFLKWGQAAFENFRVVPPGMGICHQINLEYLGRTVWSSQEDGGTLAYPDTLVGTDSHTTMINGLSVLGWGVGGIEAEAAMLGQPVSMLIPEVVGVRLTGSLPQGTTATDLVLTVTEKLRKVGVVGRFVEYYGPGLSSLPLEDRATISNMSPEYGATCGYFPVDDETLKYLKITGRDEELIRLVEHYAKEQYLWNTDNAPIEYTQEIEVDLSSIEPSIAGPRRPQDRSLLRNAATDFRAYLMKENKEPPESTSHTSDDDAPVKNGDVVLAAITSCTNTSNPSVMIAAGLLARKAVSRGLRVGSKVKTSLAPGSRVVAEYLKKSGLDKDLETLGFYLVGYGCTTCIGNSGPLNEKIEEEIKRNDLVVAGVLSGNRNFEGRINPVVKASYLASPPLVVAHAISGSMLTDLMKEPLGMDEQDKPVYLADIWPEQSEIAQIIRDTIHSDVFHENYKNIFVGEENWRALEGGEGSSYAWDDGSTYIRNPPFFENIASDEILSDTFEDARILAVFGDSITTDHISPAGVIKHDGPAGLYLKEHGIGEREFNSFGSRRGNHEVMMRGTFANIRIRNTMVEGKEGGYTVHHPSKNVMTIYEAAMLYQYENKPVVVFAGREYGTGSSRDWAAKGTRLLGVRAVIAESFERIHRSNLVGMGVLPLQYSDPDFRMSDLKLTGSEVVHLYRNDPDIVPGGGYTLHIRYDDGRANNVNLKSRIDTGRELEYFKNDGILPYVLKKLAR